MSRTAIYRSQPRDREWETVSSLPNWWNVARVSRKDSDNASEPCGVSDCNRHFQWCRVPRDASLCEDNKYKIEKFLFSPSLRIARSPSFIGKKREMRFRRKFWNLPIGDHYLIIVFKLTCQATVSPCIVSTISAPHRIHKIRVRNSAGSVRSGCRSRQRFFRILCSKILRVIVILECKRPVINIKREVWKDKRNN